MRRLLLLSNSGRPPFAHCAALLAAFLPPGCTLSVITAARLDDEAERFRSVAASLSAMGLEARHVTLDEDGRHGLETAEAVMIPGGNTYALLKRLFEAGFLDLIAGRVREGMPYLGSSAGTNIAGPDILATNDWNVVGSSRFEAMGLIPWAINPHYLEADPSVAPGGETRDQRIGEYVACRRQPALAIEEGAALLVEGNMGTVVGTGRARLFGADGETRWLASGEQVPASGFAKAGELG